MTKPALALCAIVAAFTMTSCAFPEPEWKHNSGGQHSRSAISTDMFGINVAFDAPDGKAVQDLGARWARIELIDPTATVDLSPNVLSQVSNRIDDYHKHGIKVLVVLDYQTYAGFNSPGGVTFCPDPSGDFSAFRAGFVQRVTSVANALSNSADAWQIWNEPDHPCTNPDYKPRIPANLFGPFAKAVSQAIHKGSSRPVVVGGLESGDLGYVDTMIAATGGTMSDYANAIAIQIYGVVPNDSWCVPGGPGTNDDNLKCEWGRLDGKVSEYHGKAGLPVWVTEFGFKTTDTVKQAKYLDDAYHALASTGDKLGIAFWFCFSDAMVEPFGLTDKSWSPKPQVYAQYQALAKGAAPPDEPPGGGTGGTGTGTGGASNQSSDLSCGQLGAQNGWSEAYCEWNGNNACKGQGPHTLDCDHC